MITATECKRIYLPIFLHKGRKKYHLNLNQYRNWHYLISNTLKKQFKQTIYSQLNFTFDQKIQISYIYYAPDKRKRDLMNVIVVIDKFFQDALTEYNCIKSDDTDTVVEVKCQYGGVDRENPRVEASIYKL